MTQNEKREKPAKIIGSLKESTDHENPMNLDCKYTKALFGMTPTLGGAAPLQNSRWS